MRTLNGRYSQLLAEIKTQIQTRQSRAILSVNRELIVLYWNIGRLILERQEEAGWGAKVIEQLAHDLRADFPEMKGLSRTNLLYMRAFATAYPEEAIVQQLVGQLPWGHQIQLLNKVKDPLERQWYLRHAAEQGWSRTVLVHQIDANLYHRQGKAVTNFRQTLEPTQAELAQALFKDPYNFDFLNLSERFVERELEQALLEQIRKLLLELGTGFAFLGSQYPLEVSGQDFYLDLLFYNVKLRCFVVVDLKTTEFRPEYAGKMNFYVNAVNLKLRHPSDQPTIGLILCHTHERLIVELSLEGITQPIGVSTYVLHPELRDTLPTLEQFEAALRMNPLEDRTP